MSRLYLDILVSPRTLVMDPDKSHRGGGGGDLRDLHCNPGIIIWCRLITMASYILCISLRLFHLLSSTGTLTPSLSNWRKRKSFSKPTRLSQQLVRYVSVFYLKVCNIIWITLLRTKWRIIFIGFTFQEKEKRGSNSFLYWSQSKSGQFKKTTHCFVLF